MEVVIHLEQQERQLITACMREERWAQKQLYELYYGKMLAVCMRYANDREDAMDILNEGFVKVYRNLFRYKPGTSLEAWIRRVMVNTSIDFYRRGKRNRTEDIEIVRHHAVDDEDAVSRCSAEDIMKAVQNLPPSYRAVFNLFAVEGYSHKEIGDMLNITESTSRSNLVKARQRLQEMLLALHAR